MKRLRQGGKKLLTILVAVALATGIFTAAYWSADRVHNSELLTQSRILRVLIQDESVDVLGVLREENKRHTLKRFIVGLTGAYIDFELIPINEGETFAAVISSLVEGVYIEEFRYSSRDLFIFGKAADEETYLSFFNNLRNTEQFQQVVGEVQTEEDGLSFFIQCQAKEAFFTGLFEGI